MLHAFKTDFADDHAFPPAPAERSQVANSVRSPAEERIKELSVTSDLAVLEPIWRAFERVADCTPFQTFDWLTAWQQNVGRNSGVKPAVVIGRFADRRPAFILPLAIERTRLGRRLVFLGHALCDYNAPLLAKDFGNAVPQSEASVWWQSIHELLRRDAEYAHDIVVFDKMPEKIGQQANPLLGLATRPHASSAYRTNLGSDWERYYTEKRSSSTRSRDRSKRKKLAEAGELRISTPTDPTDIAATLAVLFSQKSRSFARMGVANLFAHPGYGDFFIAAACRPDSIVHVSRLDVGETCAAVNLGMQFGGCYYHVLASHDDGPLSRLGPGVVHLHELMRHAIAQGCAHFDFTIGDESYKLDWAEEKSDLHDHISAASLRGMILALDDKARRQAKRYVKKSRWLWPLATRLRAAPNVIKSAFHRRASAAGVP